MRRRSRGSRGMLSRRRLLLGLGAGLSGVGLTATGAFNTIEADRVTTIGVASDPQAYVEMLVSSEVKMNQREPLVDVTNNVGETLAFVLSLDDCGQGVLYSPTGNSGCTVSYSLPPGSSATFDIESSVSGVTVPFTIDASSTSVTMQATRSTDTVSGNTAGAVEIKKVKKFSANVDANDWTIQTVEVEFHDNFGDRVEYKVTDSTGTVVGTRTDSVGDTNVYEQKGTNAPAITIDPDAGYTVQSGETYDLTVTAWDVEDNFDTAKRDDTA